MSARKVLILPSWYSTKEFPDRGVFFREQAVLASERFDVRLFSWTSAPLARKRIIRWGLNRLKGPQFSLVESKSNELFSEHAIHISTTKPWKASECISNYIGQLCIESNWIPDVIHAHCAMHAGQVGVGLAKLFQKPLVVTEHQHVIFDYFSNKDWSDAKSVYASSSAVYAVSRFQKHMMLMNGVGKVDGIVGNFVDDNIFDVFENKPRDPKPLIVSVGLNNRLKSHITFIESLAVLREMTMDFKVCLVVPSQTEEGRRCLQQTIEESGLREHVDVLGSISRQSLAELFNQATVFVSASLAETFGVAACEALMCGCPVVTTDSGGIRDFVRNKSNGYIVPVADSRELGLRTASVVLGERVFPKAEVRDTVIGQFGREAFLNRLSAIYCLERSV